MSRTFIYSNNAPKQTIKNGTSNWYYIPTISLMVGSIDSKWSVLI